MVIQEKITTNLEIKSLADLRKLKAWEDGSKLKANRSELGRQLGVDRRTIEKYINGYKKPVTRKTGSQFDKHYDTIIEMLEGGIQKFTYKRILWQYMIDNHEMVGAYSSFRKYIKKKPELQAFFNKTKTVQTASAMRFETDAGKQAQVDWKEKVPFILDTGEQVLINIFVFLLSFSRFRIYRLSLSMTRDILCHYLNDSFEVIGGVPEAIIFDNMKTVMDEPRTPYRKGKINDEFANFAKDYDFEVKPCIAGRPQTKAKVEAPMKILDELLAYNGKLSFEGLIKKLAQINNRENSKYHEAYQMHPILGLGKEKDFLKPLPTVSVRNLHHIKTEQVRVNQSSLISYKSNHYSVPPEYIGKLMQIQVHDEQLCIYYDKLLVTIHTISEKKLNYLHDHYVDISKLTLPIDKKKIEQIATQNLERIGRRYDTNAL